MAITVFLAGVKSSVQSFICDATIEVSQSFTNNVASFPVDTRNNVSDHVFNTNPTFTVKGIVTNHPVNIYDSNIIGYDSDRVSSADRLLQQLWKERTTFSLLTEYNDFNDCVLESYSASFTAATSEALEFEVTIKQIRKAKSELVYVVLPEDLAVDSKKDNNGSGQVETQEKTKANVIDAVTRFNVNLATADFGTGGFAE